MDESLENRVFDSAAAELLRVGVDDFGIEGVACRAAVNPEVITRLWHDRRVLLMETLMRRVAKTIPIPDTGSLRGDLQAFADSLAAFNATSEGRTWFRHLLPNEDDMDFTEVRPDYWNARFSALASIIERAAQRSELREDITPGNAIRMFTAAYLFNVIFNGEPPQPDYAAEVLEIFLRGITR